MINKKNKRILIVEDEKPMAHALELKLTKAGFEVAVFNDGEAALKILETQKFNLILLDLMMPKVDGFGVLEELKKRAITTPVIVSSNLGQEEDAKRAKSLGAVDYIIKSDTPIAEIIAKVQKVIG